MKSFLSAIAGVGFLAVAAPANAGLLYGINDQADTLFTIETSRFATTTIGSLGTDASFSGLGHDPNTDMIGDRSNNNLFTVSRNTGAASIVGNHGVNDLFGPCLL
ncbi:MAG: hypothetical protein ACRBM6_13690 [Geminicoccales bacterium]